MALAINDSFDQYGFENIQFITLNAAEEQHLQTALDMLFANTQVSPIINQAQFCVGFIIFQGQSYFHQYFW